MSKWATEAIKKLQLGQSVVLKPRGNSMLPHIKSGQEVLIEPIGSETPAKGSVVLCSVNGNHYLHFIKARSYGTRFLIGNARGGINGWTDLRNIYGIAKL